MTMLPEPTRLCIRLPCELPAEITFSGGETEIIKKAIVSNISTTGIQILSPSFIATGQKVQASFKVPGQTSKTTLYAEVIRIESLQGRMIGHYPYALGAKFVASKRNQTNEIARFISSKITCASGRMLAAMLCFILGIFQVGRTLLHTFFASSNLATLDLRGFSGSITENWVSHPLLLGSMALGFLFSALFYVLNKKNFMILGFFWALAQILLSAITLFARRGLLSGDLTDMALLCGELLLFGLAIGLITININLRTQFKKIEESLSADRSSSGLNRPTFTIL